MRAFKSMLSFLALLLLVAAAPTKDWKDVEAALGRAGTVQPDGAYKVSVTAVGIDLSAIGHGWAVLNGGGFFEPGTFSTDADSLCSKSFKAMPRTPTKLQLGAVSTP